MTNKINNTENSSDVTSELQIDGVGKPKDVAIKNQNSLASEYFTKKFLLKKSSYKNLVIMATEKFYDVDTKTINIIDITSSMLNDLIDQAFNRYRQNK